MKIRILIPALLLLVSTLPAAAGVKVEDSLVLDRGTIVIGAFSSGISTDLRIDSKDGSRGTTISLEDDLGLESTVYLPAIEASYILGQRHEISVAYVETSRDNVETLSEDIEWGDITFPVTLSVRVFYETKFANLAYTYWFYSSEKTALGVTGAFALFDLSSGLEAAVGVGPGLDLAADVKTAAPTAQVGFSASHALSRRFVLGGVLTYITFSDIDGYSGDIGTFLAKVEHRTWNHFGFGLSWNYTSYDIDTESIDFLGNFGYTVNGFQLYGRVAF